MSFPFTIVYRIPFPHENFGTWNLQAATNSSLKRPDPSVAVQVASRNLKLRGGKLPNVEAAPTAFTFGNRITTASLPCHQQRYEQRKEERLHERQKTALAAAATLEVAKEDEETRRMVLEELRSWDAYELNTRNHERMIEQARMSRACGQFPCSFALNQKPASSVEAGLRDTGTQNLVCPDSARSYVRDNAAVFSAFFYPTDT